MRCLNQTPAETERDLQTSDIPSVEKAAQHQVYYQWQITNSSLLRNEIDPFVSAVKHIKGLGSEYQHEMCTSGNLCAPSIYIHSIISSLVFKSQELVINSIYGMINFRRNYNIRILDAINDITGIRLISVLAGLDWTGGVLCYLFAGTSVSEQVSSSMNKAKTSILQQFLQSLKNAGDYPLFFGRGKDKAGI